MKFSTARPFLVLALLISVLALACKPKAPKDILVGKWVFKVPHSAAPAPDQHGIWVKADNTVTPFSIVGGKESMAERSDTFNLTADGKYMEIKSAGLPLTKLQIIELNNESFKFLTPDAKDTMGFTRLKQ